MVKYTFKTKEVVKEKQKTWEKHIANNQFSSNMSILHEIDMV